MTVTGSDLAIRGAVSTRDFPLITEGSEVEIEDPSLPAPILGVIRLIEPQAGTRGVGADRHYIEIVSEDIPEDLIGANVRITIPVGGTAGPVLAVPVAALSASADGSTRVEVAMGNGETRFVTVEPGLSAIGLVEVTPLEGQLVEGDRVVVGYAAAG
jgi:multidrug efflux pump subunit AcrA (membrane-fusion protein)